MRRWRHFCLYSLLAISLLLAPLAGEALAAFPSQLSARDRTHAKSAFYFAERGNWAEARQHATRASNPVLRDYILWRALLNDAGEFADYHSFLRRNPGWPYESRLVLKAESLLFASSSRSDNATLSQWFKLHPPISGKGKLVYAELQRSGNADISTWVRDAWVQGDFDSTQEKAIMLRYASTLRQQDHIARTDRLIWEGQYTAAGRMMFALPKAQQSLFETRILLALNKPGVNHAITRIPASLRNDPGLIYERMKWRERKGMSDGVEELLLAAPAVIPYPHKWWRTRHIRVREALEKGRTSHALKLLANHGQVDGIGQADALWLQGWISLVHMKQPAKAFDYFTQLEKAVAYPVSKSRAQYWLGRSAAAMGQAELAQQWYTAAAQHNTTFYGQLGAAKAQSNARMRLPQTTRPTAAHQQQFNSDPRAQVVYMLAETGQADSAYVFIGEMMDQARTQTQAQMVAELGLHIKRHDYAVQASKDAMKQHIVLPQTSYPFYRVDFSPIIEEPLMWAITRQESLFNPNAKSSADARGMMQILPSTAREVARKNNISYHLSRLNDIMYNLRLGSTYLGSMINGFDGSYILAIAAYNAGPGRARQWRDSFGHPGRTPEDAINWIESIPFSETRNYVQRVLENLQVYRAMVTPQDGQYIGIERDLVR
jgi:soluble lytic murein transglycosylase